MQVYRYKDEKSDKFWRIESSGTELAVNYGNLGTTGKYQIKEFDSEEACLKEVQKLTASKVKKGYMIYTDFDVNAQLHIDDEEIGLHPLTSHPKFREHFTDEFYYDCGDEEAPFGSDEGSDTLAELHDYMKKKRNIDIYKFPQHIMVVVWGMDYIPPDTIDRKEIKALMSQPSDSIPMSQYMTINDQVIVASALGQIKIMGEVSERLKALACRALHRLQIVFELEGYGFSATTQKMIEDLESFRNPPAPAPSENAQTIMDYLACPCEVFCGMLDDDDMIYAYEQALKNGKEEGYTPLLVTVDDTLLEAITLAVDDDSDMDFDPEKVREYRKATIEEALTLDAKKILKQRGEELDDEERVKIGKVAGGDKIERFTAFWNYDTKLSKEVILAKVSTSNPWELPIYLPMGGFNDCPPPAQQAAIMKYWFEKYGAVPGLVTYDEWECILPAPIENEYEALKVAKEQYHFCYDRVEQYASGYTIGKLAHCLTQSDVWYFWWD